MMTGLAPLGNGERGGRKRSEIDAKCGRPFGVWCQSETRAATPLSDDGTPWSAVAEQVSSANLGRHLGGRGTIFSLTARSLRPL